MGTQPSGMGGMLPGAAAGGGLGQSDDDEDRATSDGTPVGLADREADVESSGAPMGVYEAGSWPLANIQVAQALKTRLYDFHFRYGVATHSSAQGAMDLPESLSWLWRGYDPEKTAEAYEQEEVERGKPIFRVRIANRGAW